MHSTEKNCLPVNNSNPQTTDVHDTNTNEKANAFYFKDFTFTFNGEELLLLARGINLLTLMATSSLSCGLEEADQAPFAVLQGFAGKILDKLM